MYVKSFRDLEVYRLAKSISNEIYKLSLSFPRDETYSLTDQIRRSSRSVGAQIAEAWGKRRFEKYFISKLTDSDGEQLETQHWLGSALDCNYISAEKADELLKRYDHIGNMLNSMILKASLFCYKQKPNQEDDPN